MFNIPKIIHLIWMGRNLPFIYGLAARAAAQRGGLDRVILHHTDPIEDSAGGRLVHRTSGVECSPLDPTALLEALGDNGPLYVDLFRGLERPSVRSDLLRYALLFRYGGVYIDADVITVTSLRPLLDSGMFCGTERVAYPERVANSRSRLVRLAAVGRSTLRSGFRTLPRGYRLFDWIAWLYPPALNGAVLGSEKGHPLVGNLLAACLTYLTSQRRSNYDLGPHLLQRQLPHYPGDDLRIHPPRVFFPLAPEIAKHLFRVYERVNLSDVLHRETRAVHWYASAAASAEVEAMTPEFIRAHSERQLFSQLVAPLLD